MRWIVVSWIGVVIDFVKLNDVIGNDNVGPEWNFDFVGQRVKSVDLKRWLWEHWIPLTSHALEGLVLMFNGTSGAPALTVFYFS